MKDIKDIKDRKILKEVVHGNCTIVFVEQPPFSEKAWEQLHKTMARLLVEEELEKQKNI